MRSLIKFIVVCMAILAIKSAHAEVFLPGMQPKEGGIEFANVQQCRMCHAGTKNKDADPFFSWLITTTYFFHQKGRFPKCMDIKCC